MLDALSVSEVLELRDLITDTIPRIIGIVEMKKQLFERMRVGFVKMEDFRQAAKKVVAKIESLLSNFDDCVDRNICNQKVLDSVL